MENPKSEIRSVIDVKICDDFNFKNLTGVIKQFCNWFELNPVSCILQNLEFGVNVSHMIPANDILKSVINHKGKPFTQEYTEGKRFRECERQRYIVKLYNKGLQFNRPENILRFEVKVIKMAHIERTGVKTLANLSDPIKIKHLGDILGDTFNEVMFYDHSIRLSGLSQSKRLVLTQGQTPSYWSDLMESNPDIYYKRRQRFRELVKINGTQDVQEIIGPMISQKWNELLTGTPETFQVLTDPAKQDITEINRSDKGLKPGNFVEAQEPRFCQSCGRDISNQRKGSKFCSAKYVGYVEAHRCRNIDSNPRNRAKYIIKREKETLTLFSEKQRIKIQNYWDNKKREDKQMKYCGITTDIPLEDEVEYEDEIKDKNINRGITKGDFIDQNSIRFRISVSINNEC